MVRQMTLMSSFRCMTLKYENNSLRNILTWNVQTIFRQLPETTKASLQKLLIEIHWKWKLAASPIEAINNKKQFSQLFFDWTCNLVLRVRFYFPIECATENALSMGRVKNGSKTKVHDRLRNKPNFFFCTIFWNMPHNELNAPFWELE